MFSTEAVIIKVGKIVSFMIVDLLKDGIF